ncbi:DUF1330 domain-containing protein [Cupriavidus sp. CV2]|uniref:DUF1330 domain-containing protein n=1 Tax=Cupriavidus ulmosensis TaxID=3065913 RepID=UPI00296AF833|nr:DUF1330 domain-containing protein [Cupriavidus sp. CV2]MDW3689107.1 DUF1330 domain-containing protein [Cupriavidus sp. CV2]
MKKTKHLLLAALMGATISLGLLSAHAQTSAPAAASATKPAYYVAEFQLTDPEGIKPYSAQVESTFERFSGRYVVRGGELDVKEGFGAQGRPVMIKFDSLAQARAWYESPEYKSIISFRHRSGNTRAYIVEGLEEK